MVILQNNKRVFDKPTVESNTSTATARVISLYGVTSYDDLVDCIIPIKAIINGGSGASTVNINSLGTKPLKIIVNGTESDPITNWVLTNKVYYMIYNSGKFTAFCGDLSSSSNSVSSFAIDSDILYLSDSSSQADILAVTGDTSTFIANLTNPNVLPYIYDSNTGLIINILCCYPGISGINLEFIYDDVLYKYEFTITSSTFSSVTVTTSALVYSNGNNMQF